MGRLSSFFNGFSRSLLLKRRKNLDNGCENCDGREAVEAMVKDAKKNEMILTTSGTVTVERSQNFASVFSKRGQKGVNQDCCIVWEEMILTTSGTVTVERSQNFASVFSKRGQKGVNQDCCIVWEEMILTTSGTVTVERSQNFASVFSKRGQKGVNQDCCIVWEEFGCQEDMILCGIFDGHGPWGHFVAKRVRESMLSSLLCNWQEALAEASLDPDFDLESDKKLKKFHIWKHSYLKTCAAIDQELEHHSKIDSFYSGTTALTIVRQDEHIFIANVGDSRAVLATTSETGNLVPVQLTVDFKPNLPQEAERINQCKGRVFCLHDEPGVHRVWLPDEESPGLAMSRAFGDYCVKDFGLVSVPEVTQRHITSKDQFVVLATDGVWDVISNEEAVEIVSSSPERAKSARLLVERAVHAWKKKRKGIAMDDISAIILFFYM